MQKFWENRLQNCFTFFVDISISDSLAFFLAVFQSNWHIEGTLSTPLSPNDLELKYLYKLLTSAIVLRTIMVTDFLVCHPFFNKKGWYTKTIKSSLIKNWAIVQFVTVVNKFSIKQIKQEKLFFLYEFNYS